MLSIIDAFKNKTGDLYWCS